MQGCDFARLQVWSCEQRGRMDGRSGPVWFGLVWEDVLCVSACGSVVVSVSASFCLSLCRLFESEHRVLSTNRGRCNLLCCSPGG